VLTVIDEDTLEVEHVITLLTITGLTAAICRVFLPEEDMIYCPELLLRSVLAHIHYMPAAWRSNAHTTQVRTEFSQLFQFKLMYALEEVLSPVLTPLILIFVAPNKALEIVDFVRNFSVEVTGVGDVCSFALLDIGKHGNPQWQPTGSPDNDQPCNVSTSQAMQGEEGKTELSLINFTLTNPSWKPSDTSNKFLSSVRETLPSNSVYDSIAAAASGNSLQFIQPISLPPTINAKKNMTNMSYQDQPTSMPSGSKYCHAPDYPLMGRGVRRKAGPLMTSQLSRTPIVEEQPGEAGYATSDGQLNTWRDALIDEMCSSVLALHDNHHQTHTANPHFMSSTIVQHEMGDDPPQPYNQMRSGSDDDENGANYGFADYSDHFVLTSATPALHPVAIPRVRTTSTSRQLDEATAEEMYHDEEVEDQGEDVEESPLLLHPATSSNSYTER
jgi:hypothetical protein